jgi:hypothetical protein
MKNAPILLTISEFAFSGAYSFIAENLAFFVATVIIHVLRWGWKKYTGNGKKRDHLEKLALWYLEQKNRKR